MKKFIYSSLLLCMAVFGLSSCGDDELTDTRITYYAVMTVNGDEFVQVPIGTSYTDAGCDAVLNGTDYSSNVVAEGVEDVDVNTAGLYTIAYYVTNPDGYTSAAYRTVAVCDPTVTTDISGVYNIAEGSFRDYGGNVTPFSGYTISLKKAAPGIFTISDWMGGYYDQRAGYGSGYAMKGYVQLLSDNTLNILSGDVAGWGDSYDSMENGVYDPATSTLSWDVAYAGAMTFHIVANK